MNCGVCGKSMSDGTRSMIGLVISFKSDDKEWQELARKQFGEFDLSCEYMLCYECWLKSFGFRPKTDTTPDTLVEK